MMLSSSANDTCESHDGGIDPAFLSITSRKIRYRPAPTRLNEDALKIIELHANQLMNVDIQTTFLYRAKSTSHQQSSTGLPISTQLYMLLQAYIHR